MNNHALTTHHLHRKEQFNPSDSKSLLQADREHVWHPFTQMKAHETTPPLLVTSAKGPFLYDAEGRSYYDAIASWWVNVHGHGHPRLAEAAKLQMDKLDHVIFSGATHPPGIELAERVAKLTPPGLNKVFYSDNGSTAVEVAIKMSLQYWQLVDRPEKQQYAYLSGGYHGDTVGAISVGGVGGFHDRFKPLRFQAHRLPAPTWHRQNEAATQQADETALSALKTLLQDHGEQIAALVIEPIVQAAGGMNLVSPHYVREAKRLCSAYDVHLIADEVAVGFGRTGRLFACEHAGISPDFMCLSKALSGGVLPLAVTVTHDHIYDAFYSESIEHAFLHGHSFTGNPVSTAVALASLDLYEEEKVLERVQKSGDALQHGLQQVLGHHPHTSNLRGIGMMAAFDVVQSVADDGTAIPYRPELKMAKKVCQAGLEHGILLRPLDDTLYFWPPLCVTKEQVADMLQRTAAALHQATR